MPDRQTANFVIPREFLFQRRRPSRSLRWSRQAVEKILCHSACLQGSRMWKTVSTGSNNHGGSQSIFVLCLLRQGMLVWLDSSWKAISWALVTLFFRCLVHFAWVSRGLCTSPNASMRWWWAMLEAWVDPLWFTIEVGLQFSVVPRVKSNTSSMSTTLGCFHQTARLWRWDWLSSRRTSRRRTCFSIQARSNMTGSKLWELNLMGRGLWQDFLVIGFIEFVKVCAMSCIARSAPAGSLRFWLDIARIVVWWADVCWVFFTTATNLSVPTTMFQPSVASELRAFCGLMPLLRSEWSRPWNEVVTVSDASEEGFGVCADRLDRQAVASIGRVSERDRFRRSGGHSARESALTSAGFVKSEVTGQWAEGVLDDEEYLQLSGWDLDPRFPEISKDILQSTTWSTVRQGPWKKKEHIVHLESRALVKSMEFAVHDNLAANTRQLFLVDSMSAALAFDRCRSKNYRMLRQIRKFCSVSLARNISFSVRWVPSELNPADGPSRDSSQLISSAPQWRQDGSKEGGSFGTSFKFNQQEKKIRHLGSRFGGEGLTKEEVSNTATRGVEDRASTGARFCFPNFGSAIFPLAGSQQAEGAAGVGEHRFKFRISKEGRSGTTVAEKEPQPPQEIHSPEDGVLSTWPHPLGAEGHWRAGLQVLQRGVPGNEELCKEFGVCLFNTAESRCNADQILQSPFPSRPSSSQGRQDSGLCDAPSSSVWKTRDRETTPQLEVTEGLETSCSRLFSKGVSPGHLGSHLLRDEEKGLLTDGLVHYDGAVFICPSRGTSEVQGLQSGAPQPLHNRVLDFATESRREGREVKGGGVRRQLGTRFSLSEALAFPLMKQLVNRSPELPLWCFDYSHYSKIFGQVVETLGLDMTPYQLRHSGPSTDRSRNLRSLLEVQKRGRWRSHKSVARYEKSARLAANFQSLSPALQHHCLLAEQLLGAVMLNRSPAPTPPSKPRAWRDSTLQISLQELVVLPKLAESWAIEQKSGKSVGEVSLISHVGKCFVWFSKTFCQAWFCVPCWHHHVAVFQWHVTVQQWYDHHSFRGDCHVSSSVKKIKSVFSRAIVVSELL